MPVRSSGVSCVLLARGGHRIYDVETGEQTLAALTKHSFDLAIISLELPGLGTADTLRLFRFSVARGDWPAFIGLAQQPSMTQIRDYAAVGVSVVLPKPVRPQALLAAVADLLRGTHDEPEDAEAMWGAHPYLTGELACLDERALQEVENLGANPSFLADLIAEFLEEVQASLGAVRQTLEPNSVIRDSSVSGTASGTTRVALGPSNSTSWA